MLTDINVKGFKPAGIYNENDITGLSNWVPEKSKKAGRTYEVYTKTIHHKEFSWILARGIAAFALTFFTLGFACISKSVRELWIQAVSHKETLKIKVVKKVPPYQTKTNEAVKNTLPTSKKDLGNTATSSPDAKTSLPKSDQEAGSGFIPDVSTNPPVSIPGLPPVSSPSATVQSDEKPASKPLSLGDRFKAIGDDQPSLIQFVKDLSKGEFVELLNDHDNARAFGDKVFCDDYLIDFLSALDDDKFYTLFKGRHELSTLAKSSASKLWDQNPGRLVTFFKSLSKSQPLLLFKSSEGLFGSYLGLNDIRKIIKFLKSLSENEFTEILNIENNYFPSVLDDNVFENEDNLVLIDCLNELNEAKINVLSDKKSLFALSKIAPEKLIAFLKALPDTKFAFLFKRGDTQHIAHYVNLFEVCAQTSMEDSFEIVTRMRRLCPSITEELLLKDRDPSRGERYSRLLVYYSASALLEALEKNKALPPALMPHFFAQCFNPSGESAYSPKKYDEGSDRRLFGELLGNYCKLSQLPCCLEGFWGVQTANPRPSVVALLQSIVKKGNKEAMNAAFSAFLPNREKFTGATLPSELIAILPVINTKEKVEQILYHLPHDKEKTESILKGMYEGWGMDEQNSYHLPFLHVNLNKLTPLIAKFSGELSNASPCQLGPLKDTILVYPAAPSADFNTIQESYLKPYLEHEKIPVASLEGITYTQWSELYDFAHANQLLHLEYTLLLFLTINLTSKEWDHQDFKNQFSILKDKEALKEIKEIVAPEQKEYTGKLAYKNKKN